MFSLPPLPPWNAAHVLLVHFPIGLLLLAAPALLGIALIIPPAARQFAAAAAIVFAIGTAGLYVAAQSGGAAYELAKRQGALDDPEIAKHLNEHADLGVKARNFYTVFTALLALYLLLGTAGQRKVAPGAHAAVLLVFLAGSVGLGLVLANAGHLGGELVHVHGITAPLEGGEAAAEAAEGSGPGAGGTPMAPPGADVD
jgi:uncharacterized membrane protein